jgi:two-component system cell cycle sensor histidine kinase PleC
MSFLRFISVLGILAIGGAAGYVFSLLPGITTPPVMQMVEKNNDGIAQGYINAVWKKYRTAMLPLLTDTSQLKNHPEIAQFAQDTMQYFQSVPVIRANLYTASGALLMTINSSTSEKPAFTGASPDTTFVTSHINGNLASKQASSQAVQTVIPIRIQGATAPDGIIEIIAAMPDFPQVLMQTEQYIIGAIAAGAIVLLLILFIGLGAVTKKTDAIITRQHEAHAELVEAVNAAQTENRNKSQFLANVSHELRTPLNAIIGFSEILKTEIGNQLAEKYGNYINDINSSGTHLLSLINDILDYSKAEAGKLDLEVAEINVTKLVQNSIRLVSPRAETAEVKLVENLPKESLSMVTDSKKLKQALLNILSNAVKFTPSGGEVKVSAWYNIADDTLTFEVRDTGIGIAQKDIARAMEPFSQIDNTLKRKYEGTGLGLPLTKKFIELMGGQFTIESEVNKGTTISLTLPRAITVSDGVAVKKVA